MLRPKSRPSSFHSNSVGDQFQARVRPIAAADPGHRSPNKPSPRKYCRSTKPAIEYLRIMISHVLLALLPVALAAPAPAPAPIAVAAPHPMVTPRASLTDRTPTRVNKRDVLSSIEGLGGYLTSVIGSYPSYIASGVPNFFQDFPTGSAVEKSLGISDSDLQATPTQVLNIP